MHEIEAPRGNCGGVLVGKLLRFRIDAGLAGIDQPEKACLDLRVDFGEDEIALLAGDLAAIDAEIESIPNFQKAQWGEKDRLASPLHLFSRLCRTSPRVQVKGDDESRILIGQES